MIPGPANFGLDDRLTRRQRRTLNRQHGPVLAPYGQAAPSASAAPPPGSPRRGLAHRARATIVRRHVRKALSAPALAPVVAVAVVAVFAALALGVIIGGLAVATMRGDNAA